MRLTLTRCDVRSWKASDADALAKYANNRNIWINLRDAFPHPYSKKDARAFLDSMTDRVPETMFAIAVGRRGAGAPGVDDRGAGAPGVDDEAVGGIGFVLHQDVERVSAEIGYWLAEPFWGRGIVSEALAAVTDYAIRTHSLTRVYAVPFAWNPASCRVLEKAGYVLEGRLRKSAIKDGKLTDQLQYAFIA